MEMVQMNNDRPMADGLVELNTHMHCEQKQVRDGVTGEGQGFSEEDEWQINDDFEDNHDGNTEVVKLQVHMLGVQKRSKQQQRGSLVCWERFLPLTSLKVLLVENDGSTRHMVCALLRNCGYEVNAVSNALQAWEILEKPTNHIDLVLTEVVMPCLSGIGLLCKIMSHKTCKKIPVIMMSSHDSMSIVYKCLSKDAADFLVKPIRKNELKNLWQHVWRKCHSVSCCNYLTLCMKLCGSISYSELQSSGSESESGIWTQNSTKSKSVDSDNNTGSNNEDDIGSLGLKVGDRSDNGRGTQVIHSSHEELRSNWVPETATRECDGQEDERVPENVVKGKDLEIGAPKITGLQLENQSEKVPTNIAGTNEDKLSEISPMNEEKLEKRQLELNGEKTGGDLRSQATGLIGVITSNTDAQIESAVFDILNGVTKLSDARDKAICDTKEIPSLELSLKRPCYIGDTGTSSRERNVLRHSDLSAFSRYNSGSIANQAPTGDIGSCSPLDNSSEAAKPESMKNFQSNSNSMPPKQQSDGSSNNNDMGSTTNNSKPVVLSDKHAPKTSVKSFHPFSAFQLVQNSHASAPQPLGKGDAALGNTTLVQARGTDQQVQVQHHHHHHHYHHHHVQNMPQNKTLGNHDYLSLENMAEATPQCGSSNVLSARHVEGNAVNHSLNGSASGHNHGSNGQNGSSNALNTRGMNVESENRVPLKGGAVCGVGVEGRNGVDQNHFAQREAALNKFRQKRKERCFEKKVRYQSRKKLAEKRPRIRGQFVRQVHENKNVDTNC